MPHYSAPIKDHCPARQQSLSLSEIAYDPFSAYLNLHLYQHLLLNERSPPARLYLILSTRKDEVSLPPRQRRKQSGNWSPQSVEYLFRLSTSQT